jgi:hypothetical protein
VKTIPQRDEMPSPVTRVIRKLYQFRQLSGVERLDAIN